MVDRVLFQRAAEGVAAGADGPDAHVFAAVRFGLQRHQGFLQVIGMLGVDMAQVRAAFGGLDAAGRMQEFLRAGGLPVAGAGVAGAVGIAQRGEGQAGLVAGQVARRVVFAALAAHLAEDGIAAYGVTDEVQRVRVVGRHDDQRVVA